SAPPGGRPLPTSPRQGLAPRRARPVVAVHRAHDARVEGELESVGHAAYDAGDSLRLRFGESPEHVVDARRRALAFGLADAHAEADEVVGAERLDDRQDSV